MQPAHANTFWAPVGHSAAVVIPQRPVIPGPVGHDVPSRWVQTTADRATRLCAGLTTLGSILLSDPTLNHSLITRRQMVTPLLFESQSSLFPKQKAVYVRTGVHQQAEFVGTSWRSRCLIRFFLHKAQTC